MLPEKRDERENERVKGSWGPRRFTFTQKSGRGFLGSLGTSEHVSTAKEYHERPLADTI